MRSKKSVLSSKFLVPGSNNLELGTENLELETKTQKPGTWNLEPGTRNQLDPAYQAFAAQAAHDRLARVTCEVDGVREAKDIEYVHRMRVASRRLRTAL